MFSISDRVGVRCADVMCAGSHRLPLAGEDAVSMWNRRVTAASAQAAIDAEKARADRLAKALDRTKRVLDNTAITNALRMVGAYEILDAALQQETQP